jgi:uncharacterized protein YfaS (alpha-2-macroglobulin family)
MGAPKLAFGQAGDAPPLRITGVTPSGANVPAGRQIVVQFDRAVVPIGRMERATAEIPIAIMPALECEWRWLDTSTLACQLGDEDAFRPATRYTIVISPGIAAEDGATIASERRFEFVTERPHVGYATFATWRSPGTPVIRVAFSQAVSATSVTEHLYLTASDSSGQRIALAVEPDPDTGDAAVLLEGGGEARQVWRVSPMQELPAAARAQLRIEPGLVPAVGELAGVEARVVVEFATFPQFEFLGVICQSNANEEVFIAAANPQSGAACNPLSGVGLAFSAPVIGAEVRDHVEFLPDLAGGRSDYDPWANRYDYSMLFAPHEIGRRYVVWLPERLQAAQQYSVRTPAAADGPQDEFGRPLAAPFNLAFMTDHRPPAYTLVHTTAVLERGVDSEVPLYVTNLDGVTVNYRALTPAGAEAGRSRTIALPDVEDVQYGVPLGVREMLGAESGAVYGTLATDPPLPQSAWASGLFAQITPYQLHVKLGHFNTLVWVADLATGRPVRNANVAIYTDRLTELAAGIEPLAAARTDSSGIALLAGTETLDPQFALLDYGCDANNVDACPRLFVRVDGQEGIAVMPLDYRFQVNSYRASNYTVWEQSQRRYGHLHAWGTTAQGVYRAGDTIEFKLYVRDQDNESYVRAPAGPYTLEIVDPTGRTVHTITDITLSEFGGFGGSYAIPQTAAVGWYQFQLTAGFAGEENQLTRYPLRVLVSDFTPSPFGVAVSLNGDLFEAGDSVSADVRATLFSGGPYIDAEARVAAQIVARQFRSVHPLAAAFRFDTWNQPQSVTIAQAVERVGAQGALTHAFAIPADLGNQIVYGRLTVEGAVRDDRGAYVASAAGADFVAVDRLVGLRSRSWVFTEDEPAEIEYLVVDPRGAPAAGTDVRVAIERLETKAARVKGAGNAYLTEFIDEWIPAGSCEGASATAPSSCVFTPEAPGSYRATATIRDTRGRVHTTTLDTWVAGVGHIVWRDENDDALEIVPEKAAYTIGETARYLLKNPYPGARALITIERYGTLKQWVQTLATSTPVLEFEVEKDFMPGFYLSVLVMSPRVETPPPELGELDLGKPAFKIGYVAVPVDDPYKQIDVEVTIDGETYKPGATVRVRVAAAPREREQRERIEVAVAVLDEAVLDLIQGGTAYFDPYAGFYTLDGLDVLNYSLLTRLVGRQKIELKGANPGGDGGAAFSMRSLFKYVSYWNPSLELDRRGNGTFDFDLPDNLTGWRVLVLATTPTDRMGLGQASFKVNLPTEVRPVMPNQVTEGDRFDAAFSVMNRTDTPRDIRVAITTSGDVSAPATREETVHLEPFARTVVQMPVAAGRVAFDRDVAAGRIAFTVVAQDALDADGLSHDLTVRKRSASVTAASYGTLEEAAAAESLLFPERIRTDVGDVGVVLAPSVLGNVEGAFRYLRDYPYTCWEQQLTKGVMAAHFARLRDYLPADLEWPESGALPARMLAQAANFQAPNGGMAYFLPQDAYVSPYLSAYTALAFTWLREDGHAIPTAVETKLQAYLETFLKRDAAPDFYSRGMASTVRAVALAALAKQGKLTLGDLARYRDHVEYMSLFGKAHYLQAALAVEGGATIAREIEQMILNDSSRSGGKLTFNELLDDGYLRISATPLNSNCAVLSALTESAAASGVPFALVRAITQARGSRDHWENTQENMFCMNALVDYAQRYESVAPDMRVNVGLGGTALGATQFTSVRDEAVSIGRPIDAGDPGASSELTIERSGEGRLYYSTRLTYAPLDTAAAGVNAGVEIRREYSVQRGAGWVLLESPARVRRGELVRVDLYLSLPTARNFLVVDDPVPGGLEPVNRDLANVSLIDADAGAFVPAGGSWWFERGDWRGYRASRFSFYHQELRHDAVRFYSDYLPPGNYHLSYTAQAVAAGEFAGMPARAEEMYDPDVYGLSMPVLLQVEAAR